MGLLTLWNAWQVLQYERKRYQATPSTDGKIEQCLEKIYRQVVQCPILSVFVVKDDKSMRSEFVDICAGTTRAAYTSAAH